MTTSRAFTSSGNFPKASLILRQLRNMLIVIVVSFFLSPSRRSLALSFISLPSLPSPNSTSLHLRFRHLLHPRPRLFPLEEGRKERKHRSRTRNGCPRISYSHPRRARRPHIKKCKYVTTGSSKGPCNITRAKDESSSVHGTQFRTWVLPRAPASKVQNPEAGKGKYFAIMILALIPPFCGAAPACSPPPLPPPISFPLAGFNG